jgi:hypothetical protein
MRDTSDLMITIRKSDILKKSNHSLLKNVDSDFRYIVSLDKCVKRLMRKTDNKEYKEYYKNIRNKINENIETIMSDKKEIMRICYRIDALITVMNAELMQDNIKNEMNDNILLAHSLRNQKIQLDEIIERVENEGK